jgi:CRISPR/Cas system endoribonuclease Cas6 (RAMP superfamily)
VISENKDSLHAIPRLSTHLQLSSKTLGHSIPTTSLVPLYSPEWVPYLFRRLCKATTAPIDYSIKPTTIAYDERRRIRGFTGWTIIDTTPIGRKNIERIDKLMALANYLGLGKSRGIGFGKVKAATIERKRN